MSELYITFGTYIVIVFAIGIYASRITNNLSDYILAGRDLPGPVVALGAGASDMSSWLLMALPGAVFAFGINQIWLPIGLSLGAFLNWQFVAIRLRDYTEVANDSLTIPAYFDNRFRDKTKILRIVTATIVLVFFTFYASAGFVAAGYLVQQLLGISYFDGLMLGSLVIIVYICIGGFFAVSWIDFFQGSLMFFALVMVALTTTHHIGGWDNMMKAVSFKGKHYFDSFSGITTIGIISLLAWGLGYFGQPQIIVRFMAAKNKNCIALAQFICMTWMIIALYFAVFIGFAGHAYFGASGLKHPEAVLIVLAKDLLNPWIAGIVLAGVLSSAMSATSAQLLASASAATEDFYHLLHRNRPQRELVWVARFTVLIIGFIAIWMAASPSGTIFQLVSYAWAGLGASFGPVVLVSLYWKRMTRNSALAGMIVGAVVVIVWEILDKHFGGIFKLYSIVPGFVLNSIVIYIVSMLGKHPGSEVINDFKTTEKLVNL